MIKSGIKGFLVQLFGSIIGFALQFLAARLLGAEEFGRFNYFYGYIGTLGILLYLGFPFYIPKVLHKYDDKRKFVSTSLSTLLIMFALVSLIAFIFLKDRIEETNVLILILFGSYGFALLEFIKSYYFAMEKPVLANLARTFVPQSVALCGFLVIYFFLDKSFWSIYISTIASYYIIVLPFLIKNIRITRPDFQLLKGAFPFFLVQTLYFCFGFIARILQGEMQSLEVVAILSIAFVIRGSVTMLGTNFSNILMPEFAKAWDLNQIDKIKSLFKRIARLNLFIVFPIILGIIFNAGNILAILGNGYEGGEWVVILITLSSAIAVLVGPNGTVLLMTGNHRKEIFNGALILVVGLSISFWLGTKYTFGIALAFMVAETVVGISKKIMTHKLLSVSAFSMKDIIFILIAALIQGLLFAQIAVVESLILWVLLNGIAAISFIYFNFRFSTHTEDRLLLVEVKSKVIQFLRI